MKHRREAGPVIILLSLLLMLLFTAGNARAAGTEEGFKATEKGAFKVSIAAGGKGLEVGPNSLKLSVRDRQDKEVTGAEIAVLPWMPDHGHGVHEKPVVREHGGGSYKVDNVDLMMGGLWEIRITIKKGPEEDRAVFAYEVGWDGEARKERGGDEKGRYRRTRDNIRVPDVTLLNQDGKKVAFKSFLDPGKTVIVDFIFTTCTTICPILSAGFANLRDDLGPAARSVQFVSISIDPEHDRPHKLKEYLERYDAGEGWDFLTGSRQDIATVMKAFDAMAQDKMAHKPLYFLRGSKSAEWIRVDGLIGASELLGEFKAAASR